MPVDATLEVSREVSRDVIPDLIPAPPALEVAPALRLALTRLARRIRQADVHVGVTLSQLSVMRVLQAEPWLTLSELAASERVQPPTMTRLVGLLEQAGMVQRRPDPGDRRIVRVALTESGAALLHDSHRRRNAFLSERLAHLDEHDMATLHAALPLLERLAEED